MQKTYRYLTLRNSAFLSGYLYVWPNATLTILADGKSRTTFYDTQKYLGSASFINTYLVSIPKSVELTNYQFGSETYKLSEEKFTKIIKTYFSIRDSLKYAYFKDTLTQNNGRFDINTHFSTKKRICE